MARCYSVSDSPINTYSNNAQYVDYYHINNDSCNTPAITKDSGNVLAITKDSEDSDNVLAITKDNDDDIVITKDGMYCNKYGILLIPEKGMNITIIHNTLHIKPVSSMKICTNEKRAITSKELVIYDNNNIISFNINTKLYIKSNDIMRIFSSEYKLHGDNRDDDLDIFSKYRFKTPISYAVTISSISPLTVCICNDFLHIIPNYNNNIIITFINGESVSIKIGLYITSCNMISFYDNKGIHICSKYIIISSKEEDIVLSKNLIRQ